jgi:lysine 2,3-aminomutase
MSNPRYITRLDQVEGLSDDERRRLRHVAERYPIRVSAHYLSLIDWSDPNDPIRRIIVPSNAELNDWGSLDPSNEEAYTRAPGLEHKYEHTALLLVSDSCGGQCRFCFRKRLFMGHEGEVEKDLGPALAYIRRMPAVNNVLLTGGDSLMQPTRRLESILESVLDIDHVRSVRLGSKMLAFDPGRITDDPELIPMLGRLTRPDRRIYLMAHFNHPREITPKAIQGMDMLMRAGIVVLNQTPLLRGINDDPVVLGELFNKVSDCGVTPYYLFQCRPTVGNHHFSVPIEEGYEIFERARMAGSGLSKRARFVMSHSSGKIEMVGRTDSHVFMRYHRSADHQAKARFMSLRSKPDALWFDDYDEAKALMNDPEIGWLPGDRDDELDQTGPRSIYFN